MGFLTRTEKETYLKMRKFLFMEEQVVLAQQQSNLQNNMVLKCTLQQEMKKNV